MISFKDINLENREEIQKLLSGVSELGCSYCFGTLFFWRDYYYEQFADVCGCFTSRISNEQYGEVFLCPVGGDLESAIEVLAGYAEEKGSRLTLGCVSEENRKKIEELFPGKFEFIYERNDAEYIYLTENLAELKGKKYHGKKNQVNHFLREYQNWQVEPITAQNIDECRMMDSEWVSENALSKEDASFDREILSIKDCFDHFEELGLEGLILRVDGKIAAFTVGEVMPCGNCMDVHFEKALDGIEAAYKMINLEYAKYVRQHHPEVIYLNREDDLGLEGLRLAKESYKPVILYSNYVAVLKEKL